MADDNPQASNEIQIDENIAPLVAILNSLPGISTNSSCGGHENPTPGQAVAGEWYVDFCLLPDKRGWQSLELIAFAVGELLNDDGTIELTVWHNGGVRFDLRGCGSDPNELAQVISDHAD